MRGCRKEEWLKDVQKEMKDEGPAADGTVGLCVDAAFFFIISDVWPLWSCGLSFIVLDLVLWRVLTFNFLSWLSNVFCRHSRPSVPFLLVLLVWCEVFLILSSLPATSLLCLLLLGFPPFLEVLSRLLFVALPLPCSSASLLRLELVFLSGLNSLPFFSSLLH